MTEDEALAAMVSPGAVKLGKYGQGVIQILLTSSCDKSCFGCTQASNLRRKPDFITIDNFTAAVRSLESFHGVVGIFGGNPALHPHFEHLCDILAEHIPKHRRGLWCNNPLGHGKVMARTFNPHVSNLNVHMDQVAWDEFRLDWKESMPFGLLQDSRHAPVHGSMMDLESLPGGLPNTEENRWGFISTCDYNREWSGLFGQFRGELRFWFCEIAGAQALLHQHDSDYPDTGMRVEDNDGWTWALPMSGYAEQARYHCHRCIGSLKAHGENAMSDTGSEQTTVSYADVFKPKRAGRPVEIVYSAEQLGLGKIKSTVDYLGNSKR